MKDYYVAKASTRSLHEIACTHAGCKHFTEAASALYSILLCMIYDLRTSCVVPATLHCIYEYIVQKDEDDISGLANKFTILEVRST